MAMEFIQYRSRLSNAGFDSVVDAFLPTLAVLIEYSQVKILLTMTGEAYELFDAALTCASLACIVIFQKRLPRCMHYASTSSESLGREPWAGVLLHLLT